MAVRYTDSPGKRLTTSGGPQGHDPAGRNFGTAVRLESQRGTQKALPGKLAAVHACSAIQNEEVVGRGSCQLEEGACGGEIQLPRLENPSPLVSHDYAKHPATPSPSGVSQKPARSPCTGLIKTRPVPYKKQQTPVNVV
ncbi:UNVERIFIED_CONTAM: hypothetical protein FKN15_052173 [Acipenser sinensis]